MTTSTLEQLQSKSSKELVDIFNRMTGENVKRFATKTAGLKRISRALKDGDNAQKLEAILGVESTAAGVVTEFDDGSPIETAAEVITKAAKKREKDHLKPKPVKNPDSNLVNVNGRHVRPENVKRVQAGEALWGEVLDAPADKDRLKGVNARLNLNYPAKDKISEPREGTGRYKLVQAMKKKGVTVEEVMRMFNITHAAAIYKLRDLHYVGGHGLQVKKGRVFLRDK